MQRGHIGESPLGGERRRREEVLLGEKGAGRWRVSVEAEHGVYVSYKVVGSIRDDS